MKNKIKQQRTKLTTGTYMKEALNYKTLVVCDNSEYYVAIKKYLNMSGPFHIHDKTLLDNGYYLVEITPINENYNIRHYVSSDFKYLDYYIDITLENGLYGKVPYYVDLYLDIVNDSETKQPKFVDEDELLDALKKGDISKKDYNFAYKIGNKVLNEIKSCRNKYLNMDIVKIVQDCGI